MFDLIKSHNYIMIQKNEILIIKKNSKNYNES